MVLDIAIHFEFHYLCQVADRKILRDMEPIVHVREHSLIVRNFLIDWLNHNCEEVWVLETVVFILHFTLDEGEKLLEVIFSHLDFWVIPLDGLLLLE